MFLCGKTSVSSIHEILSQCIAFIAIFSVIPILKPTWSLYKPSPPAVYPAMPRNKVNVENRRFPLRRTSKTSALALFTLWRAHFATSLALCACVSCLCEAESRTSTPAGAICQQEVRFARPIWPKPRPACILGSFHAEVVPCQSEGSK